MPHTELDSRSKGLRSQPSRRALWTRWQLAWLVALAFVGLAIGVSAAVGDPDWKGTEPSDISSSPKNKAWQPAVAAGPPAQVVVAWGDQEDSPDALRNIYIRRSDDNAGTWSAPEVISTTAYHSALPDVCLTGTRTFVAWVEQPTIGAPSVAINEAEVGGGGVRSVPSPIPLGHTRPSLGVGSGRLHLVFSAGANILHSSRPLAVTAWPTATRIYTSTTALNIGFPALAIGPDGETLHVVWQEEDFDDESAIMYVRGHAHDAAVSWEPARELAAAQTSELFFPTIAVDSAGNPYVVWGEAVGTGGTGEPDQYLRYTRCDVSSSVWISPALQVDANPVRTNQQIPFYTVPSLALFEHGDRVEVCVAWHGFRAGGIGEEILLSCSWDQGQSWSVPENVSRSVDEEAMSLAPSIAFDAAGRLHGVWQEHDDDMGLNVIYDYQVYHTRALDEVFLPLVARN
jgi:hypothetical protein